MNDSEFITLANKKLDQIEEMMESQYEECDVSRMGNVLQIIMESGQEIVLNLQTPLHELWMASRLGGRHYQWNVRQQAWVNTKNQKTLDESFAFALKQLL